MSRPALFLDRDGVINEEVGYLYRFEDVRFVEGIVDLIAAANIRDYFVCVVTNQAGIGRGLYSEEQFQLLMQRMREALATSGARIDAVYHSPYHPEHGVGDYKRDTDCRKPRPGMLLRAAADHDLLLADSMLVGDRCSDLMAGSAAGLQKLFLLRGTETAACETASYVEITHLHEVLPHLDVG